MDSAITEGVKILFGLGAVGVCFVIFLNLYVKKSKEQVQDLKATIPLLQKVSGLLDTVSRRLEREHDDDLKLMAKFTDLTKSIDALRDEVRGG